MFCAPVNVFGNIEGFRSRFLVLCSRTRFWRCGGRRLLFSCFTLPDTFLAVPRASGPVVMFCVPVLIFGNTEGVGSRFHVLRRKTRFLRCGGRRLLFSWFALPDTFSAVSRASGPVFMFCVPVLVFGGAEGVGSCVHVSRSRAHFQRYRGRRVRFHVFRPRTRFWQFGRRRVPFSCFRAQTRFRRCGGRRVPLSCFGRPNSFSTVPKASALVFMFCALEIVFGSSEGVGFRFHVLRPHTRFWRY
jgi:hypothetical protein